MQDGQARAYLERIGAPAPTSPDVAGLARLARQHLATVPFENLSIHLGEPIDLSEDALLDKIVGRRRGGFCYELNGALGALLAHLGYAVTPLAARVFGEGGALGPPYDHLALRVDLPGGERWLVDVGFGAFVAEPFRLDERGDQVDPLGTVRLVEAGDGDLDVLLDGVGQYRLDPRPRDLGDFEATCWYQQTHPRSHFVTSLVCSLPTPTGRVTLSDRLLVVTERGERTERTLASDAEVLEAYREHFAITLEALPSPAPSAVRGPTPAAPGSATAVSSPGD